MFKVCDKDLAKHRLLQPFKINETEPTKKWSKAEIKLLWRGVTNTKGMLLSQTFAKSLSRGCTNEV